MFTNWQKVECQKFIFWISVVVFNLMLFITFVDSKHSGFIVKVWQLTWKESIKTLHVQTFMKNGCVHCTSKSSQTKKKTAKQQWPQKSIQRQQKFEKVHRKIYFLTFLQVSNSQLFFQFAFRNKLKKHSVSKIVLNFHCLNTLFQ